MNINPYQSPRVGEPMKEQPIMGPALGDADSVRQLLVEIRDGQRELLELQREALTHARETMVRAQRMRPFSYIVMAIAMIIMIALPFYSITRIRAIPTIVPPARPVSRSFPVATKTTQAPVDEITTFSRFSARISSTASALSIWSAGSTSTLPAARRLRRT